MIIRRLLFCLINIIFLITVKSLPYFVNLELFLYFWVEKNLCMLVYCWFKNVLPLSIKLLIWGWIHVNRFNTTTVLRLFEAGTWISNVICLVFFYSFIFVFIFFPRVCSVVFNRRDVIVCFCWLWLVCWPFCSHTFFDTK